MMHLPSVLFTHFVHNPIFIILLVLLVFSFMLWHKFFTPVLHPEIPDLVTVFSLYILITTIYNIVMLLLLSHLSTYLFRTTFIVALEASLNVNG